MSKQTPELESREGPQGSAETMIPAVCWLRFWRMSGGPLNASVAEDQRLYPEVLSPMGPDFVKERVQELADKSAKFANLKSIKGAL